MNTSALSRSLIIDSHQHKRVYTVRDFVNVLSPSVPGVQRGLDEERVANIVEFQKQCRVTHGTFCFVGDLTLFDVDGRSGGENESQGRVFLIDGLHRYEAMKQVWQLQPDYNVCANVVLPTNGLTLEKAFLLINMARPVPEYVINTTLQMGLRELLDGVRVAMMKEYKAYVTSSFAPRPPNFNLERLVSEMLTTSLTNQFRTVKDVMGYVRFVNLQLARKDPYVTACATKKLEKSGYRCSAAFFSADPYHSWMTDKSMVSNYLGTLIDNSNTEIRTTNEATSPPPPKTARKRPRKSIPRTVRHLLWKLHFGESPRGVCLCCQLHTIEYTTFHAGHVVSHRNGGSDALQNLLPLCAPCNLGMGSMNLDEFQSKYGLGCAHPPNECKHDNDDVEDMMSCEEGE